MPESTLAQGLWRGCMMRVWGAWSERGNCSKREGEEERRSAGRALADCFVESTRMGRSTST